MVKLKNKIVFIFFKVMMNDNVGLYDFQLPLLNTSKIKFITSLVITCKYNYFGY